MKEILISAFIAIQAFLGINSPQEFGATILRAPQGGTGLGTATAGDVGKYLKVSDDSPFTFVFDSPAGSGDITGGASLGTGLNIYDSEDTGILRFNSIAAGSNITLSTTTNDNTIVIASTASGGGGTGNVSTSTNETAGRLAYWTSNSATPALLGEVSTTTLTASSPLSLSNPVAKVGGSNSVLTIDTSGTWSGNAGTATSLANNGANCSAGNFPLGVDASGAVESCTDAWTEAENTSAAYISLTGLSATWPIVYNNGTGAFTFTGLSTTTDSGLSQGFAYIGSGGLLTSAASSSLFGYTPLNPTRQLTVAGTANQITSSAGAQDLSADRTWTLSIPSQFNIQQASTTLLSANQAWFGGTGTTSINNYGLLSFPYSTSTIYSSFATASTSVLTVSNSVDLYGGGAKTTANALCIQLTGSSDLCDGSDDGAGGGLSSYDAWTHPASGISATTSQLTISGLLSTASTTIVGNATTTGSHSFGSIYIPTLSPESILFINANGLVTEDAGLAFGSDILKVNNIQSAGNLGITGDTGIVFDGGGSYVFNDLTTDGFLKTSSSNGTLVIDTTAYAPLASPTFTGLVTFPYSSSTIYSSFITASTTNLNIGGDSFIDLTGTGLAVSGGILNTANIPNASLANSTISGISLGSNLNSLSNDATLNGSSYNGSSAISDWGLNLANANTWTAKQDFFGSASSTLLSANWLKVGGTASTTIDNLGNITYTGLLSGPYSSSTIYSSFITASTTNLRVGLADGCLNITSGLVGSTGSACGSASGLSSYDAWTHDTNFNEVSSATTSPLWIKNDIYASSTVRAGDGVSNSGVGTLFGDTSLTLPTFRFNEYPTSGLFAYNSEGTEYVGLKRSGTDFLYNQGTETFIQKPLFSYSSSTVYSTFLTASSTFAHIGTLNLPNLGDGCLEVASGVVTSDTCGTGGVDGFDFSYGQDLGFGVTGSATTTKTQFTLGIHASSTSQFDNATSTLFTAVTGWFTNLFIGVDTLAEYISDTAGAFFTGNTETGITVTYQDADNTVDVVCNTADTNTFGCLTDTDWDTFNNKQATIGVTWPITLSGVTLGFDGISTSSAPTIGNVAYWTGVNKLGTVATTSASCSGGVSCTGFDIFGSSPITISSFTYPFPSAATSTTLTLSGGFNASGGTATLGTVAGAIDAGGATSLEVPNGTNPTVDAIGEIAFDTTANQKGQLLIATSTNASYPAVFPVEQKIWGRTVASTSVDFISGGRQPLTPLNDGWTITKFTCAVDGGTSVVLNVDTLSGGANTTSVTCATTKTTQVVSTNNTLASTTLYALEWGTVTGTVDYVTWTAWGIPTRE